jgi:hypothetical protein
MTPIFRKWAIYGRLANIVLVRSSQQPMMAREADLASALGLSRTTLRHYRDATRLVRQIDDSEVRHRLWQMSAVAANSLARWYQRDPQTVRWYVHDQLPRGDAQIVADARRAKISLKQSYSLQKAISGALAQYGSGFQPQVLELIDALTGYDRGASDCSLRASDQAAAFLGVDLEIELASETTADYQVAIGVMEIAELVVLDRYRQEARAIWARSAAATLRYPLVLAVFPSTAARRRFVAGLPSLVANKWIGHPSDRDASQDTRRSRCASQAILCRPAPVGGTIMLTTRMGLSVDLYGQQMRGTARSGKIEFRRK